MLKLISLLKGTTTKQSGVPGRQAATSESLYLDAGSWGEAQFTLAHNLLQKRAALLPVNCSIYGQIFVQLDAAGDVAAIPSYSRDRVYPGAANLLMDIPQAAVSFKMSSQNKPNRNTLKLAFMPDARIVTGEYHNADNFSQRLEAYMAALAGNFGFRGLDSDADSAKVDGISSTGIVTFANAPPAGFINGVKVRFIDGRSANGNAVTGTYTLRKTTDGGTVYRLLGFTLPRGETTSFDMVKGELVLNVNQFCKYYWPGIVLAEPKACTKKIGRPRDLYVGRRSTKR